MLAPSSFFKGNTEAQLDEATYLGAKDSRKTRMAQLTWAHSPFAHRRNNPYPTPGTPHVVLDDIGDLVGDEAYQGLTKAEAYPLTRRPSTTRAI